MTEHTDAFDKPPLLHREQNVELVERAVAAINARDIEGYLACCTEDVVLRTPMAEITGVYEGADGIKRFLVDIEEADERRSSSDCSRRRPSRSILGLSAPAAYAVAGIRS